MAMAMGGGGVLARWSDDGSLGGTSSGAAAACGIELIELERGIQALRWLEDLVSAPPSPPVARSLPPLPVFRWLSQFCRKAQLHTTAAAVIPAIDARLDPHHEPPRRNSHTLPCPRTLQHGWEPPTSAFPLGSCWAPAATANMSTQQQAMVMDTLVALRRTLKRRAYGQSLALPSRTRALPPLPPAC